jgi:hypothetical protein
VHTSSNRDESTRDRDSAPFHFFVSRLSFRRGRPSADDLYALGFIEFADAAYHRFDEMAQLIAFDIAATGEQRARLTELKRTARPDLRGGMAYIDTPRHANYVETHTYQHVLAELRDSLGLPAVGEHSYDSPRTP